MQPVMNPSSWSNEQIENWVNSQSWYQTIRVNADIVTPGNFDVSRRLALLNLGDISGKNVLDIGCNSGLHSFEAKKHNAENVVGIDLADKRLEQARILAAIMRLDVEFQKTSLLQADQLGSFDMVFCFSVVTEVTDIIQSLLKLKEITKETLFLELATASSFNLPFIITRDCRIRFPKGKCFIRRLADGSWGFIPNMRFIKTLLGDRFHIKSLGRSSRHTLLRCDVK